MTPDPAAEPSGGAAGTESAAPGETETATPSETTVPDEAPPREVAPPAAASVPPQMRALLEAHNRLRAKHCAAPLAWSPELAQTAQRWADHLRDAGCAFDHSRTQYGENLAAGSTGALDADGVAAMWYEEIKDFNFGRGGFGMNTGHFTQLVWRDTQRLGCGTSTCKGMEIWVCNYDPAGNVEGMYRDNVRPVGCK